MKKIAVLVAIVVCAAGCAGPAATVITATPTAAMAGLSRQPVGAWPFGAELAEQLLRTGPTSRLDGRLASAGRGESRDLQMAVNVAEHDANVRMVRVMGREELVLSPRTEWRGVKPSSSGGFAVTVIVTADVGEGALK